MVTNNDFQRVKNKLLTLATVNVYQPIERDILYNMLQSYVDGEQLDRILNELVSENRIAVDQQLYRLTSSGYNSVIPSEGRILRDIKRMHYLADTNLSRGGGT